MTTGTVVPLADLARRHAAERPDAPAVVDGERVWTWAELDRRVDAIAATLAATATAPGGRIGLAIGPTALGVAAIHGAARAGVAAILVNPRLTAVELARILQMAGTRGLALDRSAGEVAVPPGIVTFDLATWREQVDRGAAAESVFVVATSGSTDRPKLASLPPDRLTASAAAWNEALPPAMGWLLSLGLSHVAGLGIVVRAAGAGVPVVVAPDPDPEGMLGAVATARDRDVVVSHASLVAAQLAAILDETGDAPPPDGLRAVVLGGGPIADPLVRRARDAGWPIVSSYGLTETASGIVVDGRPLPGVEVRLGDDGAILVRGPMVFAGYLDDHAATAAAIDADGWLLTNDLGRFEAGALVILGRRDDVIIRGGENISPAEVEAALASHPAVADVALAGIEDATWGEVPVAVVVLHPGASATDEDLRAHVRARLASFKVPSRFIRVRELPRTSLGKIARPEVRRLAASGERRRVITTDDGQALAVRELGAAGTAPAIVLLHATLSSSEQLLPIARRLSDEAHVVLVDRRGSGGSVMERPAPVDVARHVADVVAVLDALGVERAALVGHSFGGVVAIETAIGFPARVTSVVAWEPPFMPLAPAAVRRGMARIGDAVAAAYAAGGSEPAARLFLEAVSGDGAWDRLHPRQRKAIGRAGTGALADVAMGGLTPDGLGGITVPTLILTGAASEPFYRPIADALADRIGAAARRNDLPGMRHMAPITDPAPIADLVLEQVAGALDQETTA